MKHTHTHTQKHTHTVNEKPSVRSRKTSRMSVITEMTDQVMSTDTSTHMEIDAQRQFE